jgi:ankyrin repeat protein
MFQVGNTALINAAEEGHTEIVRFLLDKVENIDAKTEVNALLQHAVSTSPWIDSISRSILNKAACHDHAFTQHTHMHPSLLSLHYQTDALAHWRADARVRVWVGKVMAQ